MKTRILVPIAACAALLPRSVALAADREDAILCLTVENDVLAGTDRHYTHGMRISYLDREDSVPGWAASVLDQALLGLSVTGKRVGFSIGQNLYTPGDIRPAFLLRDDRPYAGWLYGGLLLQRGGTQHDGALVVWDTLELDLGVVGPESLAEQTQTWWHSTWGYAQPRGWDHQLRTEPGLLLQANRSYSFATPGADKGWGMDLTTTPGVALGNIWTFARGEVMARAGFRLTPGFATTSQGVIAPSLAGEGLSKAEAPDRGLHPLPPWSAFLFAGFEGRAVARNLFLDGNTWRESHSVDKEPFVADLKAGLSVQIGAVQLTGTYVYRTREFDLQREANQYTSISLAFRF